MKNKYLKITTYLLKCKRIEPIKDVQHVISNT